MDSLHLTHPVERLLLVLTLTAFFCVLYWKAGEAPLPRLAPLVQAL